MRRRMMVVVLLLCAVALLVWAMMRERTVRRGSAAFHKYGCIHCHGSSGAPNLTNVSKKYDDETLGRFIHDPESVYKARGRKPLNDGFMPMPRLNVTEEDASAIVEYLKKQAE